MSQDAGRAADEPGNEADGDAAGQVLAEEPAGAHAEDEAPRSVGARVFDLVRETTLVLVLALVLSSLVKTFLIQPFWIPSDSMNDTLIRDDRVVVSKLTPGPFDLARGDVVVFEDPGQWLGDLVPVPKDEGAVGKLKDGLSWVGILPSQEDNHLIKRVVGLPGDHVRCCAVDGRLEVNGTAVTEPYLFPGDKPSTIPFDVRVPDGKLWVMGDHRSNSRDSRYNDTGPDTPEGAPGLPATDEPGDVKDHTGFYGSVPVDRVVGKALAVVWPLGRVTGLGGGEAFSAVPAPTPQVKGESPSSGSVPAGTP
jgi:signal peptidase I